MFNIVEICRVRYCGGLPCPILWRYAVSNIVEVGLLYPIMLRFAMSDIVEVCRVQYCGGLPWFTSGRFEVTDTVEICLI